MPSNCALKASSIFSTAKSDHIRSQNRFGQTAQQALFEFIPSNEQRIRADRIPALVMKRAAVAIRAVPSTTADGGNTSAALRTLQQPREQVTLWTYDQARALIPCPAIQSLDLLELASRCRQQFIGDDP
jgi:hypothetical protein